MSRLPFGRIIFTLVCIPFTVMSPHRASASSMVARPPLKASVCGFCTSPTTVTWKFIRLTLTIGSAMKLPSTSLRSISRSSWLHVSPAAATLPTTGYTMSPLCDTR